MKKNILCIIGESGSGKTHVADYIERKYNIKYIQSHTDRPKRHTAETGHTWHTKDSFDKIKKEDMIAYTVFGDYRYCATKQDLKLWNTYVIDEPGLDMLLKKHQHEFNITSVRIYRPDVGGIDKERFKRNLETYIRTSDEFDYIINNTTTIGDLELNVDIIMGKYLK